MEAEAGVALRLDRETLDGARDAIAAQPAGDLPGPDVGDIGGLAYVMFTSGSTGHPKAVAVEHRGIVRLVHAADYADLGPEQVLLQLAPAAFDAATFEIWGALASGGRLVLAPPGIPSIDGLGELLARHGVTTLFLTTGLFHQVVEARAGAFSGLSQLITGGDVLAPEAARRALAALPGCRLLNAYGPTENTVFTTCHVLRAPLPAGSVPIGRPIAGTRVVLLDRWLDPAPPRAAGLARRAPAPLSRARPGAPARAPPCHHWQGRPRGARRARRRAGARGGGPGGAAQRAGGAAGGGLGRGPGRRAGRRPRRLLRPGRAFAARRARRLPDRRGAGRRRAGWRAAPGRHRGGARRAAGRAGGRAGDDPADRGGRRSGPAVARPAAALADLAAAAGFGRLQRPDRRPPGRRARRRRPRRGPGGDRPPARAAADGVCGEHGRAGPGRPAAPGRGPPATRRPHRSAGGGAGGGRRGGSGGRGRAAGRLRARPGGALPPPPARRRRAHPARELPPHRGRRLVSRGLPGRSRGALWGCPAGAPVAAAPSADPLCRFRPLAAAGPGGGGV